MILNCYKYSTFLKNLCINLWKDWSWQKTKVAFVTEIFLFLTTHGQREDPSCDTLDKTKPSVLWIIQHKLFNWKRDQNDIWKSLYGKKSRKCHQKIIFVFKRRRKQQTFTWFEEYLEPWKKILIMSIKVVIYSNILLYLNVSQN